jgi:hypothetical protein
MSTSREARQLRDRFDKLDKDSWAMINLLPQSDEFRAECTQVEDEIAQAWSEQIYDDKPTSKGLADLVESAKIMRDLRNRMGDPVPPVPQLRADIAIKRAKRLIEKGDADAALQILAAFRGRSPDEHSGKKKNSSDEDRPLTDDELRPLVSLAGTSGSQPVPPTPPSPLPPWLKYVITLNLVFTSIAIIVGLIPFMRAPVIPSVPTIVVTAFALVPTTTPLPPTDEPTAVAKATDEPTAVAKATDEPTAVATVGSSIPEISSDLPDLKLHLLGTATFTLNNPPTGFDPNSISKWTASLKVGSTPITKPIKIEKTTSGQSSLSFKLIEVTWETTDILQKALANSPSPITLALSFTTGTDLTLPNVALTAEMPTARGVPLVKSDKKAELAGYPTEVTSNPMTYLLGNAEPTPDGNGNARVLLYSTKKLTGDLAKGQEDPARISKDEKVILLAMAMQNNLKVYQVQNGKGDIGWLPAVFIDGK